MSAVRASPSGATGRFSFDPEHSYTLPAPYYYDAEIHELEKQKIFCRTWQYAGPAHLVGPEPGSYATCRVIDESIVIVRGKDGRLRAFHNICSHRGRELLEGCGKTRGLSILCPFHGWTYDLEGKLINAPHCQHIADFDPGKSGLKEVRVEEFINLLFVNFDRAAPSLKSEAPELDRYLRDVIPGFDGLKRTHRFEVDCAANWKSVIENVLENYHTEYTHPQFTDQVDLTSYKTSCYKIHVTSILGNKDAVASEGLYKFDKSEAVEGSSYSGIFPNTGVAVLPGTPNMIVIHCAPRGAERTHETWEFFFRTDPPTEEEAALVEIVRDELNPQDMGNLEACQRGMRSKVWQEGGRLVIDKGRSWFSELPTHFIDALTAKYLEFPVSDRRD